MYPVSAMSWVSDASRGRRWNDEPLSDEGTPRVAIASLRCDVCTYENTVVSEKDHRSGNDVDFNAIVEGLKGWSEMVLKKSASCCVRDIRFS